MDNQVLFKFIEEIRLECRFAKLAYEQLRSCGPSWDPERTFLAAHALLTHAANVSRLFWPERPSSQARGERLRAELSVPDTSPLRQQDWARKLAQSDAHYEDWLNRLERPGYADFNVMARGTMQGYKQDRFQRDLDPETGRLVFREDTCDLRQLAEELHRLEGRAQAWFNTHRPW